MKQLRIPIFIKFIIILVLLGAGPVIFVGIRTININKQALQTSILELHTQTAKSFADKIYLQLKEITNEIPYITRTLSSESFGWAESESILRTVLDSHTNIISISLLNDSGKEKIKVYNPNMETNPKLQNFSADPNFLLMKKNEKGISSPVYFDKDYHPKINLFYRVLTGNFLLITVSLKQIWDELLTQKIGTTGFLYLINKNKVIIAHPEKKMLFKTDPVATVNLTVNAITVGSRETKNFEGQEIITAYAPVEGFRWVVVSQQLKNEAYLSSRLIQKQAIYIIIFTILLSIIFAFFIARNLTKPILGLIKAAGQIAQRNFAVKIDIKTNDEINDLITTFNSMTSELKKYEDIQIDKLIAEKTKTEAIIFSIADGIVMTDYKGEILLINSQARNMLRMNEPLLEGKFIQNYIEEKNLSTTVTQILSSKFESDTIISREIDMSTKDHTRFYQTNTKSVITLKGEQLGIVTVVRDITLEKELDRMKEDFLHSITHDLRNPITSIRGFLGFMLSNVGGILTDQQRKMVETMDRASTKLLNMINDILDIAKLESGKIELQPIETDISDLIRKIIELNEPQRQKKNINIISNIAADVPKIVTDVKLIERVINNLIGNAIKFTPESGDINIILSPDTDKITFSIKDTGDGVPGEYLTKIFDKFQQVAGQRKGGTGLGLTICKYIVEAHKGQIWAESDLGKGAKFTFWLPTNLMTQLNNETN